jgi:hypothetical protein
MGGQDLEEDDRPRVAEEAKERRQSWEPSSFEVVEGQPWGQEMARMACKNFALELRFY